LSKAKATAIVIRGQAEAEAQKSYEILEKNPALAIFLNKLEALKESTKDRTTLILNQSTPPLDLLSVPQTGKNP
jgi:regulator of protease activity HflC (stomatin/prohibitin superfamily)